MRLSLSAACAVIVFAAASCGESRAVIVQRRNDRRTEIAARYESVIARSLRGWSEAEEEIRGLLKRKAAVDADGAPVLRVAQADGPCAPPPNSSGPVRSDDPWSEDGTTLARQCIEELRAAYPQADVESVVAAHETDGQGMDPEALMASSHNAAIEAIVARKLAEADTLKRRDLERIRLARDREINHANYRMHEDLARADRAERERDESMASFLGVVRAIGSGLAAGLGGAASALTPPPTSHQGCCSFHGGVCGCGGARLLCCDGQLSPSCGCN